MRPRSITSRASSELASSGLKKARPPEGKVATSQSLSWQKGAGRSLKFRKEIVGDFLFCKRHGILLKV